VGQPYRLRLVNITPSNGVTFSLLGPDGPLTWRAVAKDGYDLPASQRTSRAASQVTLPGETWDYEFSPERAGGLTLQVSSKRLNASVAQPIEVR
jgi:manganese oxidase